MKIGDKVRFLNDVGGGIVSGFQGKNMVLVRDADGFEIPTLMHECVVIDTDDYNIPRPSVPAAPPRGERGNAHGGSAPFHALNEEKDTLDKKANAFNKKENKLDAEEDKPITFRPHPVERRGADVLNLYLAFVPDNVKAIPHTAFAVYFINDCNYAVRFALFLHCDNACTMSYDEEVEANTKMLLDTLTPNELQAWEHVTVQAIAYKRDKNFLPKAPINVGLRIDGKKFFKLHAFTATDFFDEPALLADIVRDDHPVRRVFVDAAELQEKLSEPKATVRPVSQPARWSAKTADPSMPLEVDLHASALLETTAGLSNADILEYQLQTFRETMEAHKKHRGRKIVFIHGKGEGVLRAAIIKELKLHYKQCRYQDASFREYGFGATMVTL